MPLIHNVDILVRGEVVGRRRVVVQSFSFGLSLVLEPHGDGAELAVEAKTWSVMAATTKRGVIHTLLRLSPVPLSAHGLDGTSGGRGIPAS